MDTKEVLVKGTARLKHLSGHEFDVLSISKPLSASGAVNLAKIISKLSPIVGNLIEFNIVEFLNAQPEFEGMGKWKRQDPGFPDAVFDGTIKPTPGFEIKAWYPLATEITARFKDSQNRFRSNNTCVALLAWVPTDLVYGKPYILDVCVVSALSIAVARDLHYHNPPDYLVVEPQDTTARTRNLQQTNTNGYKWQGSASELKRAHKIVAGWGSDGSAYKPTPAYQDRVRELLSQFTYRLDTNYAQMDRIVHDDIEDFKTTVLRKSLHGRTVQEWSRLFASGDDQLMAEALSEAIGVKRDLAG